MTEDEAFPDVTVVTMRSGAKPQTATYHLMNVLVELTAVSLVTVTLAEESLIHGEYNVTEISRGAKGNTLAGTLLAFLGNQLRLCRELLGRDASVVYFFGGTAYVLPVLFARLAGKTVVIQPRGDVPLTLQLEWEQRYPTALARTLANLVRALEFVSLAVSNRIVTYTESMARELGLERFEHKLYPDGTRYIALDAFSPSVTYDRRDCRVGMVGRLDVEKGVEGLAEAVEFLSNDVEFLFVGDGDRRGWIERRLADEIASERVELTGRVDHCEIPEKLNNIKLLVLASQPTEGLPTVIQEAFACGTPVYAPPVSAIPDVVIEGETGFLMHDRSPAQIAADIEGVLDSQDLSEISNNCREFAVENYSFEASVERFRTLLSDL